MSDLNYIIYSFFAYTFLFFLIYISVLILNPLRFKSLLYKQLIFGATFSVIIIVFNLLEGILEWPQLDDGRYILLTIVSVFFGPIAGIIYTVVLFVMFILLDQTDILLFLKISVLVIGATTFMKRVLNGYNEKESPKQAKEIGIFQFKDALILVVMNSFIVLILKYISSGISSDGILSPILYTFVFIGLAMLFSFIFNKEISTQKFIEALMLSKSDLEGQNEEIRALYEQMAAAEETLLDNYNELMEYRWKLEESEKRYGRVIAASEEGFFDYYPITKVWFVSNRFCEILGFNENQMELVAREFLDRITNEHENVKVYFQRTESWKDQQLLSREIQVLCKDEIVRWVQIKAIAEMDGQDRLMRITGALMDINLKKIEQEKVEFYAFHDPVTGFLNEDYFIEAVNKLLSSTKEKFVILYIGIHDYKHLNTVYGSKISEIIQYQLGLNISEHFSKVATFSHIRAGVFGILLPEEACKIIDLEACVEALNIVYEPSVEIGNYSIKINLIYAYCLNEGAVSIEEIMEHIEVTFEFCSEHHLVSALKPFDYGFYERKIYIKKVSNYLNKAITDKLFEVVYQPQISVVDGIKVVGLEALARLNHPALGYVSPDIFIPIAENMGIVYQIDYLIMAKAFDFINRLNQLSCSKIKLAVNISYLDLTSEQVVESFIDLAKIHHLNNGMVAFEITETAIGEYFEVVINNLNLICKEGIALELDDFGKGYSSLMHLGELPVSVIKIDKEFINEIGLSEKMESLIQLMINVGHILGLKVIAEGVEEAFQVEKLKKMGCDYFQGYYYSKPLSEKELIEFIVAHQ